MAELTPPACCFPMDDSLFPTLESGSSGGGAALGREADPKLSQWMTPAWAARELWKAFFADLGPRDLVLEPTCGDGRMLAAVPADIPAVGVEIDPLLAAAARARTGREVIVADVLAAHVPEGITALWGNPPFSTGFVDRLLDRFAPRLPLGARAGLLLPAYFFQTPSRVMRWNRLWSVAAEILPRTLFRGSRLPLVFTLFTRDPVPRLSGLRLYAEAADVDALAEPVRKELVDRSGTWRSVVHQALESLGGRASLAQLYAAVGGRRPSSSPWWREKVRQTLQRGFRALGGGVWGLASGASRRRAPERGVMPTWHSAACVGKR